MIFILHETRALKVTWDSGYKLPVKFSHSDGIENKETLNELEKAEFIFTKGKIRRSPGGFSRVGVFLYL